MSPKNKNSFLNSFIRSRLFPVVLIILVGIIAYSNTLDNSFHFDDESSIVSNYAIHDLGDIKAIWFYSPTRFLTYLSFAINYHFHGLDVRGYHLINILIHLSAALCGWWLLRLTFTTPVLKGKIDEDKAKWMALIGGLFFIIHPIQTQAVTYIVQRATSLTALFYLASLCLYAKARLVGLQNSPRRVVLLFLLGSVATALGGMFSKEIAYTLPLAILLYEYCFFKHERLLVPQYLMAFIAIFFVVPLALWWFDLLPLADTDFISRTQYLITQPRVITTYLRLLVLPVNQNLDYDFPLSGSLFEFATMASVLFLLLILAISVALFKKYRLIAFGSFWFFLTLLPESSIIPIRDVIFEHRIYLPMFGFCTALVGILLSLGLKKNFRSAVSFSLLVILLYSGATYKRNEVWKDEITIWTDVISKSPNKARAYNNRGRAYLSQKQYEWASADFSVALSLDPQFGDAYSNRATVYFFLGEYDKAIEEYRKALGVGLYHLHNYGALYYNLGTALVYKGRLNEALENFNKGIQYDSNDPTIYYNRALVYVGLGNSNSALADYNEAIRLNPRYAKALNNRGVLLEEIGKLDEALADYTKAIEIDPTFYQAYLIRGAVYSRRGDYEKAISDFTRTIMLMPGNAEGYNHRGFAFYKRGEYDKALRDFETALKLNSLYPEAYYNRGQVLLAQGRAAEAQQSFQNAKALGYKPEEHNFKRASK